MLLECFPPQALYKRRHKRIQKEEWNIPAVAAESAQTMKKK
jgi:hypothetical protein